MMDLREALDVISADRGLAVEEFHEGDDGCIRVTLRQMRPYEALSPEYIRSRVLDSLCRLPKSTQEHVQELVDELYRRIR